MKDGELRGQDTRRFARIACYAGGSYRDLVNILLWLIVLGISAISFRLIERAAQNDIRDAWEHRRALALSKAVAAANQA